MSPFYATHAGMLSVVAREFDELAASDSAEAPRLKLFASILQRMILDLSPHPSAPTLTAEG